MANNPQLAYVAVNAQADALARLEDGGKLRIYSGTAPTRGDDALSGNTLLAELTLNATSAPAAVNGVLTYNAITADASADATGTATFFRTLKADGTTVVRQGTVGTATSDLVLNSTAIQAGAQVSVTAFTHTVPRGA